MITFLLSDERESNSRNVWLTSLIKVWDVFTHKVLKLHIMKETELGKLYFELNCCLLLLLYIIIIIVEVGSHLYI